MAKKRRRVGADPAAVLQELAELIEQFPAELPRAPDEIRAEVKRLASLLGSLRQLSKLRLVGLTEAGAARDRILAYLRLLSGQVIDGRELQMVGGIQEFARRVRELRVEYGFNIATGYSRADLRPDQYVLESNEPDREAAEKWRAANQVRRTGGSARDRILTLLKTFVGKPVSGEQIAYVAKVREEGRRVRELRREYGWRVVTRQTGRPDLPAGVYVLESLDQLPAHDRRVPDDVYDGVLRRDAFGCRYCGWSLQYRKSAERRQFLEVHHIEHHQHGGGNNPENLITLCNVHHDEAHRRRLSGEGFFRWLGARRRQVHTIPD